MVDIAKKYFKVIHNLEDMKGYGIAYLNNTVDTVNKWKYFSPESQDHLI